MNEENKEREKLSLHDEDVNLNNVVDHLADARLRAPKRSSERSIAELDTDVQIDTSSKNPNSEQEEIPSRLKLQRQGATKF